MKKIKITEDQLKRLVINEQLLKNLGDKIKTGVQNVKDKVSAAINPDKEITVPGRPPSKGRDMDQLRAEWSKINTDTSNLNGYGEAVSPNLNGVDMAANFAAKTNILCNKLHATKASFGYEIVDEAVFQLENGNYFKMVVLKPTNVTNVVPKTDGTPCPPSLVNVK